MITTIREVSSPSGSVVTIERTRPSLLGRLAMLVFFALVVAAGIVVFVPLLALGLVVLLVFALYLVLYRIAARIGPADSGRRNVRVIVRESDVP